jgi:hypothetical protein
MSVKSLIAVSVACLAAALAEPATAATTPFAVGRLVSGPGNLIWVGVTNVGSTNVTLSNAVIYTNGMYPTLSKDYDTCTNKVLAPGASCEIQAQLAQANLAVSVVMQATSTTGLRGMATIEDAATGRPIVEAELR